MKALYTVVFFCMSLQAMAFDLDALNAPTTVDYYAEAGAAMTQATTLSEGRAAISSEDTLFDSEFDYSSIEQAWEATATASIPEIAPAMPTEYDLNQTIVDDSFAY